jgi:hypothetical protein
MILRIFSVYDSKAEAYLPPFFMPNKGQAIRVFADAAKDPNHQFGKHPEDYTLFDLGQFSDSDASWSHPETPHPLGKAIEFINPKGSLL